MPEGPEVTIICQGLSSILINSGGILSLTVGMKSRYTVGIPDATTLVSPILDSISKAPDGFNDFITSLESGPVKITAIKNKGKFIWWEMDNGWNMWQTLGMSGGWYINEKESTGLILEYLESAESQKTQKLYYNDMRRFGTIKFINPANAKAELLAKLKSIGPDMLNDNVTLAEFTKIMRSKSLEKRIVNIVINNQKLISGVGNYLRAEALYIAKISPHRQMGTLTDTELKALYNGIKTSITASYNAGGASIRNYSDMSIMSSNITDPDEYQMAVYGKLTTSEGNPVIAEKIGNDTQTTYWCPAIQL